MRRLLKPMAVCGAAALLVAPAACGRKTEHRTIAAALVNGKAGFSPDPIRVDRNDKITLKVENRTDKTHGFSIDAYGIHRTEDPGKPITVQFTAKQAGAFKIYCQLHPTHQPATLIVR